jgi:hypothetical protein
MSRLLYCVSALAVATAAPASAQVMAEEIWAEWQASAAANGQQLTADVTETADGLILENLTTTVDEVDTQAVARTDRITLVEQGDGTLSVEVSAPYTASVTFPDDIEGNVTIDFVADYEGLEISVSGSPGARTYVYAADLITFREAGITSASGNPVPPIDFEMVMRNLSATYALSGPAGGEQQYQVESTLGSFMMRLDVRAPEDEPPGLVKFAISLGDLTSTGSGNLPPMSSIQQSPDEFPEGFAIETSNTYGFSRFSMTIDIPDQSGQLNYGNEGGSFGFAMSEEELTYDVSAQGIEFDFTGSDIPVPVAVSAASSEVSLVVPLAARPEPSQASLRFGYRDLELNDAVWGMIDPTGQVPRNPLTLVLDAVAQVQITRDLLDPGAMESAVPPGELRSLTVSELEISFGDTALTGTADMTFTPGSMPPEPVGRADIGLSGGNALLDQLQAAGVIGPEQAAMARGVAGMFSRPGATPDTLETALEFREGGSITANGMPLQ